MFNDDGMCEHPQDDTLTCDMCEGEFDAAELHVTKQDSIICAECAQRHGVELQEEPEQ